MVGMDTEAIDHEDDECREEEEQTEEHKHLVSPQLLLDAHADLDILIGDVDESEHHQDQ